MATPEHLARLLEGVDVWNKWREEDRDISCDLEGVDLRGVQVEEVFRILLVMKAKKV